MGNFPTHQYERVFGVGKLEDLLSGASEGTGMTYITYWKHWFQFTTNTPEKRWVFEMNPRWDEQIINWILFGNVVLGLKAGAMCAKISALRYWLLLSGFPDFSKRSGRYKQVLKSVGEDDITMRNYPFNLELTQWVKDEVATRKADGISRPETNHGAEQFAAMAVGFFYLLRVGEIDNLRMKDSGIETEGAVTFINLHIQGRKTDQHNVGDKKRVMEVGGLIFHITAMAQYFPSFDWGPNSNALLFGPDIRGRWTSLMKLDASSNNVNASRIGAHSIRSGGAKAMFVAGYDAEAIRRRG